MTNEAMPAPWLSSARLALRELCGEDLLDIVTMHNDARLRALLLDDQPLDQGFVAWRFLQNMAAFYRAHEGLGIWHASVPAGPSGGAARRFVGWFNLMPLASRGADAVELGSRLLPAAWGGALALEGGELLLEHGFASAGRERIWGTCHPDNRPARICLAALGFVEHEFADYDGRIALYASVTRERWLRLRDEPRRARLRRALGGAALEAVA